MAFRLTVIVLIAFGVALVGSQAAQARVRPAVSLKVSALEADLGEKLVFSGRVRPNRTGETVFIQEASHGQLRDIASGSLKPGSRFLIRASLRVAGVLRLRAVFAGDSATRQGRSPPRQINVLPVPVGIHKIKHVVVIMQENRSFDEYFGTYPGADGSRPVCACPIRPTAAALRRITIPRTSTRAARTNLPPLKVISTAARRMASSLRPSMPSTVKPPALPSAKPTSWDTRTEAISPITGPMQKLRAPGPPFRADQELEPALSSISGLGVVGVLHLAHRSLSCTNSVDGPGISEHQPRRSVGGSRARLRLDSDHLSPPQRRRQLGLLHQKGRGAGLC